MIEFEAWYNAGQQLVRCAGEDGCGALLLDGDTDVHLRFHERVDKKPIGWKPQKGKG